MITITNLLKTTLIIPAGLPGGGSLRLTPEGTAKVTMLTTAMRKVIDAGRAISDAPPPPPEPAPPPPRWAPPHPIKWKSVEERTRLVLEMAAQGMKQVDIAHKLAIERVWVAKAIRESKKKK